MIKINLKIDLSYNKQSNSKKNHLAKKEGGTLAGRLVASIDTVRQLFLSLIFNCVSQILNIKTSCCNGISIQKWLVLFRKNWFNLLYSTSLLNICSNCLSSLTCLFFKFPPSLMLLYLDDSSYTKDCNKTLTKTRNFFQ